MYTDFFGVFIAAVVYFVIGAFWYSPLLFGKPWMKLTKLKPNEMKGKPATYIGGFINTFVQAFFLAIFLDSLKIVSKIDGIIVGLFIVVGFIATTELSGVLWSKKPLRLYFIEVTYRLVGFVAMSAILVS